MVIWILGRVVQIRHMHEGNPFFGRSAGGLAANGLHRGGESGNRSRPGQKEISASDHVRNTMSV